MTIKEDYRKLVIIEGHFFYLGSIENAYGNKKTILVELDGCPLKLKEKGINEFYEIVPKGDDQ